MRKDGRFGGGHLGGLTRRDRRRGEGGGMISKDRRILLGGLEGTRIHYVTMSLTRPFSNIMFFSEQCKNQPDHTTVTSDRRISLQRREAPFRLAHNDHHAHLFPICKAQHRAAAFSRRNI